MGRDKFHDYMADGLARLKPEIAEDSDGSGDKRRCLVTDYHSRDVAPKSYINDPSHHQSYSLAKA